MHNGGGYSRMYLPLPHPVVVSSAVLMDMATIKCKLRCEGVQTSVRYLSDVN
jgi:hypothetical protein